MLVRLKKPLSVFRTEIELSIMKMFLLLGFPLSHYLIKITRKTCHPPEEETVNKQDLLLKTEVLGWVRTPTNSERSLAPAACKENCRLKQSQLA